MYVCMFTYINIHTLYPLVSLIHIHTRNRLRKTEEYFGFKKKKEKRGTRKSSHGKMSEAVNAPDYIFRISERETPLSRASISRNEGHTYILFGVYCIRPLPPTRIDFYTHTHAFIYLRCDESETVHV